MRLGIISDTHDLLRPEAVRELQGVDQIIHAGDVGRRDILDQLQQIAPLAVVRGNTDTDEWTESLPLTAVVEVAGVKAYVLHNLRELAIDPAAAGYAMVISGHTHQPVAMERNGVLFINPGSAGPRRFRLPVTLARLQVDQRPWQVEFAELVKS